RVRVQEIRDAVGGRGMRPRRIGDHGDRGLLRVRGESGRSRGERKQEPKPPRPPRNHPTEHVWRHARPPDGARRRTRLWGRGRTYAKPRATAASGSGNPGGSTPTELWRERNTRLSASDGPRAIWNEDPRSGCRPADRGISKMRLSYPPSFSASGWLHPARQWKAGCLTGVNRLSEGKLARAGGISRIHNLAIGVPARAHAARTASPRSGRTISCCPTSSRPLAPGARVGRSSTLTRGR